MKPRRLTRKPPVRWLAPSVLLRTAFPVYFSGLFARFSDRREVQGVVPQGLVYKATGTELWVDYVADVGDGFTATATVASLLAPGTLTVEGHPTEAASLLVLGGDEVYPVASMKQYEDRFIGPYQAILPNAEPPRKMVALPGNHDWYDGLTAFLQVFCSGQWIGGWKTVQRRSYFACQLPNGWWLWAIDIQFDTYIDQPQLDYFRSMAQKIVKEAKKADKADEDPAIILCWAKPSWLEADPAETSEDGNDGWAEARRVRKGYETLDWFERTIVPKIAEVRVSLTGDAHHYAHYASEDGQHRFTAGIGGAFTSATHHLAPSHTKRIWSKDQYTLSEFIQEAVYPSVDDSKGLRGGVLSRIYRNDAFPALPALAYAGLAARTRPAVVVGVAAVVIGATIGFSKPPSVAHWWRGLLHGAAHVAAGLGASRVMGELTPSTWWRAAGNAGVGAAVGPFLFAAYLLLDDRAEKPLNTNELFAAQAIEGYKGLLRLHFKTDGDLDIFPIKVENVTRWTGTEGSPATSGHYHLTPTDPLVVSLIGPSSCSGGPLGPVEGSRVITVTKRAPRAGAS